MDLVRTILLTLILLLFFTTILDLLLPSDHFRSYIKMAMGVITVLTLWNPIVQLSQTNHVEHLAQTAMVAINQEAVNGKTQLEYAYETGYLSQIEAQYSVQVEKQTEAILTLSGYDVAGVRCNLEPQFELVIHLRERDGQNVEHIQSAISGYFGIDVKQVQIMAEGSTTK